MAQSCSMTKVIKRGGADGGDITPETGFADSAGKRAPIIERSTYEARSDAEVIREKAQAQAEEIHQKAELEAEELKKKAYDRGYDEGRNTGAAELSEVVASASQRFKLIEEQAIPQLRDLALTIARKILGRELAEHPEAVVDVVKQALAEKARQRREILLRVNPEDLKHIREHKAELLEVLSRAKEIGIREDPDVAAGGVIIETDAGIIDAQLATQLEVFERVLKETR